MLRKHLNYLLAALYCRNRATMKISDESVVVFTAKLQVCMLLFLYEMPSWGALGRLWTHRQMDLHLTSSNRLDVVLMLVPLFMSVHLLAWRTERLVAFAADAEHQAILRQAHRTLLVLVVVGLIWMVVLAKYNAGTL
ncbi:hypothetical protein AUC43_12965 [Hymenobacter sedentarius]|uniref:Uncharacterized protein n=1 Tax=Hymenobacter sedentarius TaxID=1411621 RepID=A0A0U4BR62_9BACT|nr:hypothetical protein AUC43_12965 [Hymenobacter sedentarius]